MPFALARRGAPILLAALLAALLAGQAAARDVTVFAAASLKEALDEIAAVYEARTGVEVVLSFAGSSALARQIQAGAPADVFISANALWMDALEADGLLETGSRVDLLGNRLALIAHDGGGRAAALGSAADLSALDLATALGDGRLAMALVDAVPAGVYGKAALQSLGLWSAVADRIAQADNVRGALAFVASGEAPLGVVYLTDAAAEPDVRIVAVFPESSHPPIIYPAALIRGGAGAEAAAFFDFLAAPAARAAFERRGFAVLRE